MMSNDENHWDMLDLREGREIHHWGGPNTSKTPREPGQILLQLTEHSVMPEFSFCPELPTNQSESELTAKIEQDEDVAAPTA